MPTSEQDVDKSRYSVIPRSLIFIFHGSQVLLMKGAVSKTRWAGKYNGVGGHIEPGEDPLTSARRELLEETGLEVPSLRLCGVILIDVESNPGIGLYVFKGEYSEGTLAESVEGSLEWVDVGELEEYPVVEDLPVLIPRIRKAELGSPPYSALYRYDTGGKLVIQFAGE